MCARRARCAPAPASSTSRRSARSPCRGRMRRRFSTASTPTCSPRCAVGKARYGLMLREDGIALDDGTTWRLGDNDFLMTTTTANAGKVMQHLEYFLDVVWPDLKVHLTSVTDEWAGAAIAGPEGAGNPRRLRHRHRGRQRGAALHGHRAWRDIRRAGDDLPPLLLRRDGVRGLLRRRPRHPCLERADRGRQAVRPGALRAGGAGHAAHREGPCHRRRDRRPHHRARPASRLDAVEEEALRRLDDDGPRGPCRAPTASRWSA